MKNGLPGLLLHALSRQSHSGDKIVSRIMKLFCGPGVIDTSGGPGNLDIIRFLGLVGEW